MRLRGYAPLAYRIPINSLNDCIRYFNTKLASLSCSYRLMGDFNMPDICWTSFSGHSVYSNLFLSTIKELDLLPLFYEPTHRSGSTLDLILSIHTQLLTVFLDNKLYSDHFPVFAFFTIPKLTLSTAGQSLSSQFSKASFSCSVFNENISQCFDNLIFTQNSSFGSLSIEDYAHHWCSESMAVINFAFGKNTKRRQQLPYFIRPTLFIFLTNIEQLQDVTITIYVSLHYTTILINQLNSIKHVYLNHYLRIRLVTFFKFLRSFTRKRLSNQMNWKDKKLPILWK